MSNCAPAGACATRTRYGDPDACGHHSTTSSAARHHEVVGRRSPPPRGPAPRVAEALDRGVDGVRYDVEGEHLRVGVLDEHAHGPEVVHDGDGVRVAGGEMGVHASRITANSSTASSSASWASDRSCPGDARSPRGHRSRPVLRRRRRRSGRGSGTPAPAAAGVGRAGAGAGHLRRGLRLLARAEGAPGRLRGPTVPGRGTVLVEPSFPGKVTGRTARPAATITSCPLNGSWRSCDIAIRLRRAGRTRAGPAGP